MRPLRHTGLVLALALAAAARLTAQGGTPPPGVAYLFVLDLAGTALDEFPASVKALNGVMTVVDKNGQHMLRASSPSELLITLPQNLPPAFTVMVDLIPKSCCNPEDFMIEGTPARNRGVASAELTWHSAHIMAVGGGGEMYQSDMPADLAASTPGNLTRLVMEVSGTTVKLYTNGRRLYTLDKQFTRGRVLRVWLGGQDEGINAVYLAGFSVLNGAVASAVIAAAPSGEPAPSALKGPKLPVVTPGSAPEPPPPPPPPPTPGPDTAQAGTQQQTAQNKSGITAASGGPVVTGLFARVDLKGQTSLSWQPVSGATSYFVVRWMDERPECCTVTSAPNGMTSLQWQAPPLTQTGVYRYRVYAYTPGLITSGETTVQYPPPLQPVAVLNLGAGPWPLGVVLAWGSLPGASAYRVFRAASLTQPGVLLGTASSSAPMLAGNEGLTAAVDAELSGDVNQYQYWVQAVMADGSLSDPGPITPITQQNTSGINPFGGSLVPTGVTASVGGSTTITVNGVEGRGSKVTWTWDQYLDQRPVYLYFTTVEINQSASGFGASWTLYRSDAIQVPGNATLQYLKQGDAVGPPYTVGIPAGMVVRFCVTYFPTTAEQRANTNLPGCVVSQIPP